ncbi:MAG: hypothetical protein ACRDNH_05800 [Gaiellaceae bacterium]
MTTAVKTERPVFVASGNRRARALRYAAVLAVVVACVWLVALVVGMLGFGRLPGVSQPLGAQAKRPEGVSGSHAPTAASASSRVSQGTAAGIAITRRASPYHAVVAQKAQSRTRRGAKTGPAGSRGASPEPPAASQAAPPASVTPAPATPHTGWARRGATAPPGQTTRIEAQPTKPQPPGQTRRQDTTTVPATPVTPPAPPGQQKKTEEPIP